MKPLSMAAFAVLASGAWAQSNQQLPPDGFASNQVQMMGLWALMAIVPFAIMMLTSFSKIVVVLSIVRSALGTQQAPPTMVLTGLAAVLSATVMAPTFEKMWAQGRHSWSEGPDASSMMSEAHLVLRPLQVFLWNPAASEERARFVDMAVTAAPTRPPW